MPAWFKLHHELLRDKKLRLMASELKMPPALVRGLWVDLLCFAQELDQDGYLQLDHEIPLTWELVCEELGTADEDAMRFLIAAAKYNLVTTHDGTLFITSWEERQQKPSDSPERVAERMRRYRRTDAGKQRVWFDNNRGRLSQAVFERDGIRCNQCGSTESLEIDHVLALSNGGTNDIENLQALCVACHKEKTRTTDVQTRQEMKRVSSANTKRDREDKKREEEKRETRVRASAVDNSPRTRVSTYCKCGAEMHPRGDGTADLHCPVCEPAEVTK